jgi:hypothetical protein
VAEVSKKLSTAGKLPQHRIAYFAAHGTRAGQVSVSAWVNMNAIGRAKRYFAPTRPQAQPDELPRTRHFDLLFSFTQGFNKAPQTFSGDAGRRNVNPYLLLQL